MKNFENQLPLQVNKSITLYDDKIVQKVKLINGHFIDRVVYLKDILGVSNIQVYFFVAIAFSIYYDNTYLPVEVENNKNNMEKLNQVREIIINKSKLYREDGKKYLSELNIKNCVSDEDANIIICKISKGELFINPNKFEIINFS